MEVDDVTAALTTTKRLRPWSGSRNSSFGKTTPPIPQAFTSAFAEELELGERESECRERITTTESTDEPQTLLKPTMLSPRVAIRQSVNPAGDIVSNGKRDKSLPQC
jgi:hypothetical protein